MKTSSTKFLESILPGWTIESDNDNADWKNATLKSYLKGEDYVDGNTVSTRFGKDVPLNIEAFQYLWEHQDEIPESWKEKINGNTTLIFFDGTIVRDPDDFRYSLYLYWSVGRWRWFCRWLGDVRRASFPSAVVASSQEPKTLPSDSLALEARVRALEEWRERVQQP